MLIIVSKATLIGKEKFSLFFLHYLLLRIIFLAVYFEYLLLLNFQPTVALLAILREILDFHNVGQFFLLKQKNENIRRIRKHQRSLPMKAFAIIQSQADFYVQFAMGTVRIEDKRVLYLTPLGLFMQQQEVCDEVQNCRRVDNFNISNASQNFLVSLRIIQSHMNRTWCCEEFLPPLRLYVSEVLHLTSSLCSVRISCQVSFVPTQLDLKFNNG